MLSTMKSIILIALTTMLTIATPKHIRVQRTTFSHGVAAP